MSFDLKVQHRDKETGEVIKKTPYVMVVSREYGTRFFRDGIEYHPDGSRVHKEAAVAAPVAEKQEVDVSRPVVKASPIKARPLDSEMTDLGDIPVEELDSLTKDSALDKKGRGKK
jgi:hypothetical protein